MLQSLAYFYCWLIRFIIPVAAVTVIYLLFKILIGNKKEKPIFARLIDQNGKIFPITSKENIIGRGRHCDIVIRSKSAPLNAAAITLGENGWTLHPVGDILLNGNEPEATEQIGHGDIITVASAELTLDDSRDPYIPYDKNDELNLVRAKCAAVVLTMLQVMVALSLTIHYLSTDAFPIQLPICFGGLVAAEWLYLSVKKFDGVGIELCAFFLCTFGLSVAASAMPNSLYKQFIAMMLGLLLFIVISFVLKNLSLTMKLRYAVGIIGVGILFFNILFGTELNGAKNWIDLGFITVQPSEFVKIAYIFAGCASLDRLITTRNFLLFTGFSGACLLPLFIMRDFGTASIFFIGMLIIVFMRSGDLKAIILFIVAAIIGAAAIIALKPYVASRFATYLHAWENPYSGGYQQVNTMIAIGSGGLFGVGGGEGNLDTIAAADTDLVFGFIVEEWGLIIGLCCVAILILFTLYAIKRAGMTRSVYYSIAAAAASGMFLFQAALNIFGSTDLLPLTGVTLPLISNGGSSIMASMGMLAFIKSAGLGGDTR
ncbi:MAG: FtsW/RodA/SpoVE family cell cycle protein [Clostridia bacterium]|nr:FtsW/RodA/SpoVE family cell cycle protein [Clostridia bacterium]